ncbi:hypothetical protein [Salinithrix halophila]|uniref:Uncharacterized protein n=1 Tax=Salinithrix halophila TaxID=1485204 RepID=A0ABV8JKR8_9BACL
MGTTLELSDKSIEQLARCTCTRCRYRIVRGEERKSHWRDQVQESIDRIIGAYENLPVKTRSAETVLRLVQNHWVRDFRRFPSAQHYALTCVKVTDHIMQFLKEDRVVPPPLFTMKEVRAEVKELGLGVKGCFHRVEWDGIHCRIVRYTVDGHEEAVRSFFHMAVVLAVCSFGITPQVVEVRSLLCGNRQVFTTRENAFQASLDYLQLIRQSLLPEEAMAHHSVVS